MKKLKNTSSLYRRTLSEEVKQLLSAKASNGRFSLVVVFGKNKTDRSKSLSRADMDFFKTFQNIEVFHNNDLHAKYYANESASLITSLNLHQASTKSNIEMGILVEQQRFRFGKENRLDTEIFQYAAILIDHSESLFEKKIAGGTELFKMLNRENKREVYRDETETIYNKPSIRRAKIDSPNQKIGMGFCIRTGKPINFNIKYPFSPEAYKTWNKDKDGKEHFCHFSGEPSDGTVTFSKPVLRKHWDNVKVQK